MNGKSYRVLLIDPSGSDPIEVAYQAQQRDEAEAWAAAWEAEPMGLVAVVWPPWAEVPTSIS